MPDETPKIETAETTAAKPEVVTFSQDEVNRLMADRAKRAEAPWKKRDAELRALLGLEDTEADPIEAVRTLREQAAQAEVQKTRKSSDDTAAAEQRWKERLAAREAEIAKEREAERDLLHDRLVDSEVRTLLAEVSLRLADNAGPVLDRLIRDILAVDGDTLKVTTVGADGEPLRDVKLNIVTNREAVEGLLKAHPFLLRANVTGGSGATPGGRTVPDSIAELQAAARNAPNAANRAALTTAVLHPNSGARS